MPVINKSAPGRYFLETWFSRPDIDWVYVSINRAGSSFIQDYLLRNGFIKIDPREYKSKHKLVILREPLDRLLSGITFFNAGKQFIKNPKRFFTEHEFDPHIKSQSSFMEHVNLDNCTFIKFNNKMQYNLFDFLKKSNTKMPNDPIEWIDRITPINTPGGDNSVDVNSESGVRFQMYNAMKKDMRLHDIVMDYLAEDYKLYNSVSFYGTN